VKKFIFDNVLDEVTAENQIMALFDHNVQKDKQMLKFANNFKSLYDEYRSILWYSSL
jgi:hypothetical protein